APHTSPFPYTTLFRSRAAPGGAGGGAGARRVALAAGAAVPAARYLTRKPARAAVGGDAPGARGGRAAVPGDDDPRRADRGAVLRSEEHTSELQSPCNL